MFHLNFAGSEEFTSTVRTEIVTRSKEIMRGLEKARQLGHSGKKDFKLKELGYQGLKHGEKLVEILLDLGYLIKQS